MNENQETNPSRRDFLTKTGRGAAVSALAGVALPHVHAAGSDTINVALVGCTTDGGGLLAEARSPHFFLGTSLGLMGSLSVEAEISGAFSTSRSRGKWAGCRFANGL